MDPKQKEALDILQEECAEVIQAVSKISRFGLDNLKPGKAKTNREHLEEEARAERNRRMTQNRKKPTTPTPTKNINKVELPPKRKVEMMVTESDYQPDCDCGPNDACDKCIDSKGY